MNSFFVLNCLLLFSACAYSFDTKLTKEIITLSNLKLLGGLANAGGCNRTDSGVYAICASSTTVRICNGQSAIGDLPCPTSKPRCIRGECVNEEQGGIFKCPQADGYYPDPDDCRKYHICINEVSEPITCQEGTVFNQATYSCIRKRPSTPCHKIDCSKVAQFGVVVYDGYKSIFGVCNNRTFMSIGNCESPDFEMIPSEQKCKPVCKKEGNMADPTLNKSYYECVINFNGIGYTYRKVFCPGNTIFDKDRLHCVKDPSIPDPTTTTSTTTTPPEPQGRIG